MLTEEEKAGLSEDEITAIDGDQTDDEPTDDNEEDIDDDATDGDTDDTEEEADPKPKVDDAEEEEPVTDEAPAAEEFNADMSEAPFVSPGAIRYTDAVRPDIKEQLDTLREEYEAGDKELAEYEAEKRRLDAENMNWQAGTQLWEAEQAAFMDKFAGYKEPGPLRSALEGEISRIDRATNNSLSGMQLLMAAKQSVEKTFNIANEAIPAKSGCACGRTRSPSRGTGHRRQ